MKKVLAELPCKDLPKWCLNPQSFEEATSMDNPLRDRWIQAMNDDIQGKLRNGAKGAWTEVLLTEVQKKGRRPMKVKWVFVPKFEMDGSLKKLKARLVGCG